MIKLLLFIVLTICSLQALADPPTHFPDGVKIGPDGTGSDRLPIYDFDEWCVYADVQELTANEKKIITFTGLSTIRTGQTLLVRPMNPELFNQEDLLISHAYVPEDGVVKVMVRNLNSEATDFDSDQWCIGGWNTSTPQ